MARKEKIITIQDRDQTLTFKIREMAAIHLEDWLSRAALLLAGAAAGTGAGISKDDIHAAGSLLATRGLLALGNVDFEKARPLLDEILACCSRMVENVEERCTRQTVEAYVQDVKTLFTLRMEAVKINLGFLDPEAVTTAATVTTAAAVTA